MTMKKILTWAALAVLLPGLATAASAQFAISDDEAATQRSERILENLKYQLPQLRGSYIVMGEITSSDIAGLDEGSFVVNGRQNYNFLITSDDATLYLLSADPIDVSLSSAEIADSAGDQAMVQDSVALIQSAIANNRAWGNAPDLTREIVKRLKDREEFAIQR